MSWLCAQTGKVVRVVFVEQVVEQRQRLPHPLTDPLRRQVEHQRHHLLKELCTQHDTATNTLRSLPLGL